MPRKTPDDVCRLNDGRSRCFNEAAARCRGKRYTVGADAGTVPEPLQ